MSSLVADYGSSESNTSSDELDETKLNQRTCIVYKYLRFVPPIDLSGSIGGTNLRPCTNELEKLPLPKFGEQGIASVTNSVFKNPFVEEEIAKSAILEKHVKMIPAKEDITQINGKQICWMYRKGRCRFGHNCKYAHDSDLHSDIPADTSDQSESNTVCDSLSASVNTKVDKIDITVDSEMSKKKKRPGLAQGLVPGKKVMNMYKKQKLSSKKV